MSMVVRTNTMAMSANSALNKNNSTVAGNLQKLSTGFRINRAADDASGLAVSEKMKAQIKALDQAGKNAQDGSSLIKTAEGYMGEIHDMLNRIVELAEKSANGTYETKAGETYGAGNAATDRQAIQDEVDQLTTEIDRIAKTANFNQLKLLDGSLSSDAVISPAVEAHNEIASGTVIDKEAFDKLSTDEQAKFTAGKNYKVDTAIEANYGTGGHAEVAAGTTSKEIYDTLGTDQSKVTLSYKNGENQDVSASDYAAMSDEEKAAITITYTVANKIDAKYGDDGYAALGTNATSADVAAVYDKLSAADKAKVTATDTYTANEDIAAAEAQDEVKGTALKLQIGETSGDADKLEVSIMSFKTSDLLANLKNTTVEGGTEKIVVKNESEAAKTAGIDGLTFNVSNQDAAALVAEKVRTVINTVSSQRATLGAMENRLDYTMNNLDTASQNITDANSRIRDTDMAKTMMQYTQGNTLTQAAQAMLAQANQAPSQVLQLLQ